MLFSKVADAWTQIEETGSRIDMAGVFSQTLEKLKEDEIASFVYLSEGILAPAYEGVELGLGEKLTMRAISLVSGFDIKELDAQFKKKGDLGLVAKWAISKKKQMSLAREDLTLVGVHKSLTYLAKMAGYGSQDSKIKAVAELLNCANEDEAKYIVRFCVGKMRLGIAQPTILDAIARIRIKHIRERISAFDDAGQIYSIKVKQIMSEEQSSTLQMQIESKEDLQRLQSKIIAIVYTKQKKLNGTVVTKIKQDKTNEDVYEIEFSDFKKSVRKPIERAYNLCSDLAKITRLALFDYDKIENFKIELFFPIKPALAERLTSAKDIIEKIGPCAVDAKYDGFRIQAHKDGQNVELYSRKLERVTTAFPEIVRAVQKINAKKCIFEGETLAYNKKEGRYYSFQITIQRKRKYGIDKMMEDFPLHMYAFDLMYADGIDYTKTTFEKRRAELERIVHSNDTIIASQIKIVKNENELSNYFEKCINEGLEGIIAKDLSAPYVAGAREFAWIKLKKSYGALADTLDAVIVGYYLGEGQRATFNFGGLLVAVRDEHGGKLQTVAKIGSGFSEQDMIELEQVLSDMKISKKPKDLESKLQPDFWVEPKIVVSVSADEISISSVHTCAQADDKGYALRFPRMTQIRQDKSIEDITTSSEVETMYNLQLGARKRSD